jgi:NADH:ubiquinone oxidoreductase subunit D
VLAGHRASLTTSARRQPYYYYDTYDFEIPIGTAGDTYDRLMIRVEEMRQSAKIIEQALQRRSGGPVISSDPKIACLRRSASTAPSKG